MGVVFFLAGDGIGPEVVEQGKRLLERTAGCVVRDGMIGGASIDRYGVPLTEETIAQARAADAVILGAVGGPRWDSLEFEKRPEAALLRIRQELALFANIRPIRLFKPLIGASSLKPEVIDGLDLVVVRELGGGIYFGRPKGIETLDTGERRGFNTQTYTTSEIRRIARVAFDLGRTRSRKVCSVEKSNVMESGRLWREEVTRLHQEEFQDIALSHMYADNCCMQLVRNPRQFDVIVTDNLFGDLLSDEAAMLTGSLGMLPSASFSLDKPALYEPVHGSAPDIAGQNKANPLALFLSLAMMLRHSLGEAKQAEAIEYAIETALEDGFRTQDIMAPGMTLCSTVEMSQAVIDRLE